MPTQVLKNYAKKSKKSVEAAEKCWEKAKKQADKVFPKKDSHYWAFVNASTKKCMGIE